MSTEAVPPPPPPGTSWYGALGPGIVAVSWSLCCLATILIALRIYTRFAIIKSKGGWSLVWACVAWCLGFPSVILYTFAALYGLGNHIEIAMYAPKLTTALLFEWIAANTISYSCFFGKLSALTYILEVQDRTNKIGKSILIGLLVVNGLMYLATTPFIFTQCDPVAKLWDSTLPGNCNGINRSTIWAFVTGAWGTLTDLVLALYPIIIIWNLRIRKQLKLIISILMGLGLVTAVCSFVKTLQFDRLKASEDATYAIAPLMILGMTEMWVVLIASSAAPIWPLLRLSARTRSQNATAGSASLGQGGGFSRFRSHGYKKSHGVSSTDTELYHSKVGVGKTGSSGNESQEAIVQDGIMLRHDISIRHDDIKGGVGMV